ncbi:TPA: hypothetical protein N0F65_009490 [Lagenidium giganteum]|uniref:Uncharacterized protein n=1 Tax=Lagenidium giganteum TaxID=4803 RepID=A0AAV2ZE60_9STRA|nr:TPA: hypothetical protein N0F65_009490 [Lagenidium giganteum]
MYAAVCTRSDIAFDVGQLGKVMSNQALQHWTAAKHVLRYLSGTQDFGIIFRRSIDSQ